MVVNYPGVTARDGKVRVDPGDWLAHHCRCPECLQYIIDLENRSHPTNRAERFRAYPRSATRPIPADVTDPYRQDFAEAATVLDRKSTRLNSSHLVISYAVFCLKKN